LKKEKVNGGCWWATEAIAKKAVAGGQPEAIAKKAVAGGQPEAIAKKAVAGGQPEAIAKKVGCYWAIWSAPKTNSGERKIIET
jgi:hypothetical protein